MSEPWSRRAEILKIPKKIVKIRSAAAKGTKKKRKRLLQQLRRLRVLL